MINDKIITILISGIILCGCDQQEPKVHQNPSATEQKVLKQDVVPLSDQEKEKVEIEAAKAKAAAAAVAKVKAGDAAVMGRAS